MPWLVAEAEGRTFIHPFDDEMVIAGQGTAAVEILNDCDEKIDYVLGAIGGGGLMSGLSSYFKACFTRNQMYRS